MSVTGGAKLDAYLKDLAKRVANPGTLNVGFLKGATYPDGTPVATVAAAQEFGTAHIPPRPYFRGMIADKASGWGPALGETLKATDYDAKAALQMMGEGIKGQLQQSIIDLVEPPLNPKTVKRKGFDKPLIDTGTMLNAADYEVK